MIAVGGVTVLVCSLLTLVWWFFVVGCLVLLAWFLDSWCIIRVFVLLVVFGGGAAVFVTCVVWWCGSCGFCFCVGLV